MNRKFYPLLEDFINHMLESTSERPVKLEDMEEAVNPNTGNVINVKKIKDEVEKAKFKIATQSPLYRPYLHDMTPTIYTWLVPTMATDGVRLFVNPEFAAGLPWLGKIFVLIHEMMHCILIHMERGAGRDLRIFNVAGDYEINGLIVDTTDDFDANFVKNEIHGLYEEKFLKMPVEKIYEYLIKNPNEIPKPPPGKDGKPGGGPGGQPGGKGGKQKLGVGSKVKIKKTGEKGVITQVNPDGTYEVDVINESLMYPFMLEGYKEDELIPISDHEGPGGQPGGEGEGPEGEGPEGPGGESRESKEAESGEGTKGTAKEIGKAAGSGGSMDTSKGADGLTNEERRIITKLKNADPGGAGAMIGTSLGEQIARASGYDDEEMRAGADGRDKWEKNARQIVRQIAADKKAGIGRGDALVDRLNKILKPLVNWRSIFKLYVGRALSEEKQYRLGAKKHLHKSDDYLRRGLKKKKDAINKVVIAIDGSGSMFSNNEFDRVIAEVTGIVYANKIKEITVIFFDDGVDPGSIQTVKMGKKIWKPKKLLKLGGGTNFQKPLNWIKDNLRDNVSLCIIMTDGGASPPQKPPYANKVIWFVVAKENANIFDGKGPGFGKMIQIEPDTL